MQEQTETSGDTSRHGCACHPIAVELGVMLVLFLAVAACTLANDLGSSTAHRNKVQPQCQAGSSDQVARCQPSDNQVEKELGALGKRGQEVLRARRRVLEILSGENGCSAWYREKDANVAETFAQLRYKLDFDGRWYFLKCLDYCGSQTLTLTHPYAARIDQNSGKGGTITLNAYGPFFYSFAPLGSAREKKDLGRYRTMRVGRFAGDTPQAQVTTLLHELGHAIGILSYDGPASTPGVSSKNTDEVLHHCREQIDRF
jgi:hypothetical protein